MSTTPTSMTTASNAITHHWREQVDALTAPGNARKCEQQCILNKIATLWEVHPNHQLADLLDTMITRYSPRYCGISLTTTDEVIDVTLNSALAAEGLRVSGGWKS